MTTEPTRASQELTLAIEGMTCASCVNRIERYLNRAAGVLSQTRLSPDRHPTSGRRLLT